MNKVYIELLQETAAGRANRDVRHRQLGATSSSWARRGLGALRGILGSVSSYVLRNADVPVLIVKEGTNE